MATYYEGNLVLSENVKLKKIKFSSKRHFQKYDMKIKFLNARYTLTNKETSILINELFSSNSEVNTNTNNILVNVLMSTKPYSKSEITIVYEKIYDKDGNAYAKELHTGFIFPLFESNDLYCDLKYTTCENTRGKIKAKGFFIHSIIKRKNFDLCKCYCIEDKIIDYNALDKWIKNNSKTRSDKLEKLFKKNVFDDSKLIQNNSIKTSNTNPSSVQVNQSTNSIMNIIPSQNINSSNSCAGLNNNSNTQNVIPVQQVNPSNNCASINNNSNTQNITASHQINPSNNIGTDTIEDRKRIISLLPKNDGNLIMDLINNDLNDPKFFEYIKMPNEEKMKILSSRSQQASNNDKPKVKLRKR